MRCHSQERGWGLLTGTWVRGYLQERAWGVTYKNVGGSNLQDVGKGLLTGTWVRDYLQKHR